MPWWWNAIYCTVALAWTAFLTLYAFEIHNVARPAALASRLHQLVLNFLGAAVGWIALWYLIAVRWQGSVPQSLSTADGLLGLVAFYGITGYLPYVLLLKGWLRGA